MREIALVYMVSLIARLARRLKPMKNNDLDNTIK